jgi:hypothetical protein
MPAHGFHDVYFPLGYFPYTYWPIYYWPGFTVKRGTAGRELEDVDRDEEDILELMAIITEAEFMN